jgi:hypothetical protein
MVQIHNQNKNILKLDENGEIQVTVKHNDGLIIYTPPSSKSKKTSIEKIIEALKRFDIEYDEDTIKSIDFTQKEKLKNFIRMY